GKLYAPAVRFTLLGVVSAGYRNSTRQLIGPDQLVGPEFLMRSAVGAVQQGVGIIRNPSFQIPLCPVPSRDHLPCVTESFCGADLDRGEIVAGWPVCQVVPHVSGNKPVEDRDGAVVGVARDTIGSWIDTRDGSKTAGRLGGVERIPPVVAQFPDEVGVQAQI